MNVPRETVFPEILSLSLLGASQPQAHADSAALGGCCLDLDDPIRYMGDGSPTSQVWRREGLWSERCRQPAVNILACMYVWL